MADIERIEWHDAGFVAILQGDEVRSELLRRAGNIKSAAVGEGGGEYVIFNDTTPTRARVAVMTGDHKSRVAEAADRTLTKSLDAGRS
jgi:hypothetical protein